MKKIFSLILLVLLVPCVALFNGCGDKGYQLSKVDDDVINMSTKYECLVMEEGVMKFSYDSYLDGEVDYINNIISTQKPYTYLNDYNMLFDNLMAFSFEYLEECASDDIKVDKDLRNQLEQELIALDNDMANINTVTNTWASTIKSAYKDSNIDITENVVCLTRFKDLLKFYDELFISAINVSNTMSTIYFEYVLNDANPNYYDITLAEFDAGMVVNKLDARIKFQISNLTQSYIEMYISAGDLAEKLIDVNNNYGNLDLNAYDYATRVNAIKGRDFVSENATNTANSSANKETFYNTAIELYNIQEVLRDNTNMFITACNDIEYKNVVADNDVSVYDNMCVDIIESHHYLIGQYNLVLDRLLILMGV